jgi:hypothetical protein
MKRLLVPAMMVVGGALVLALMSCDGELPTGMDPGFATTGFFARANPDLHSVTGQGASYSETGQYWSVIAVDARTMPDGSVKGNFHWQFESRSPEPGSRIFVKVSCMMIVENEAWLLGQSTQAGNPDNVGKWFGVWVADNGDGQADAPDQILHRWLGPSGVGGGPPAEAVAFCPGADSGAGPTPRNVVSGNIQVR